MDIKWRGNNCDKFYNNRQGVVPFMICNHVTAGTRQSVFNWFTSPNNDYASSHFVVARDGSIDQYVDIRHGAWTQGLYGEGFARAKIPIVQQMGINPNLYMISIEHEGYMDYDSANNITVNEGLDGALTEEQFYATCKLHRFIKDEVTRIYGRDMLLNSSDIVGHFQVDPLRKPFCPGVNFPWARLYGEMAVAASMRLEDYEGRITMLQSPQLQQNHAFDIANEILYLSNLSKEATGEAEWAKGVLLRLHPVMTSIGLLNKPFNPDTSHEDVYNQALYMYNLGNGKEPDGSIAEKGKSEWALNELLKLYPYMLSNGLVAA